MVGFRRQSTDPEDSRGELVRVWFNTRTVGTYLKHPGSKAAGTQLFRRDVEWDELENIFDNPRVHTGKGYRKKPPKGPKDVPCLACGRKYRSMRASVAHLESGCCPNCPGRDETRRVAYNEAARNGANFLIRDRIAYGGDGDDDGWSADDYNYRCNCCGKRTKTLNSLMQHQEARPDCLKMVQNTARAGMALAY